MHPVGRSRRRARPVRGAAGARAPLAPGEQRTLLFLLGQGDRPRACARADRAPRRRRRRPSPPWPACARPGTTLLDAMQVRTPDDSFDALMNRWLLYQALSCRLWTRGGYYQPGGAFGFRDQLQDVMALTLRAAGRWRASTCCARRRGSSSKATCSTGGTSRPGAACARRCSDDLLWLPVRGRRVRARHRRRRACSTSACRSSQAPPLAPGRAGGLRPAGRRGRGRHALRALPARHRPRHSRPARTACR